MGVAGSYLGLGKEKNEDVPNSPADLYSSSEHIFVQKKKVF